MQPSRTALLTVTIVLGACGPGMGPRPCSDEVDGTVLLIGDSIMSYHADQCASVADVAADRLGRTFHNASRSGARVTAGPLYAFGQIYDQYEDADWDWVVIEGGVNDLRGSCGRDRGDDIVDELVSHDGADGDVPWLVDRAVMDGALVALVGYYPLFDDAEFGFGRCNPELSELRARYSALAEAREHVWFVDPGQVVDPERTPDAYRGDGIHPSEIGSQLVGELLADEITAAETPGD